MLTYLTEEQRAAAARFRTFAQERIAPHAAAADHDQQLPHAVVDELVRAGYLGATLAKECGGAELDMISYGLLTEELGHACQNVRNFVACTDMVCLALAQWGTPEQRERWLPAIVAGTAVAAFALTEPEVGSDAASVATEATPDDDIVVLDGRKKWISFGEVADVYLVFARYAGQHTAFLVERGAPGLTVEPIRDMLGLRGSQLGELRFDGCRVPASAMVGQPGAGLVFVASSALDLGRYSTAWGAVGLAQACLEAAVGHAAERIQFGVPIADHQLVRRLLVLQP